MKISFILVVIERDQWNYRFQEIFSYAFRTRWYYGTIYHEVNKLFNKNISIKDIAKMHNDYENIHPFPDDNGRIGRLMINYILLSNDMCPIVIPMS